jgi:hypothetical protein
MAHRIASILVALTGGVLISWSAMSSGADLNGERRRVIEIRLTSEKEHENPYRDIEQDGYGHPLSYHQVAGTGRAWWKEPWHDWGCAQGGHGRKQTKKGYAKFWGYPIAKPWLESECDYEGLRRSKGADRKVRIAAYLAKLCGSFGYTYGGSGVWLFGYDENEVKMNRWIKHTWHVGMDFPGAKQMAHFKTLFTGMKWWELVPCFDSEKWQEFAHPEESVQARSDDVRIVYFSHQDTATGTLKGLDDEAAYRAEWFDPRTGERTIIAPAARSKNGEWAMPDKPDAEDWILILNRAGSPR